MNRCIIGDDTLAAVSHDARFGRGCIAPDYSLHPEAAPLRKASPSEVKIISRSEWSQRCADRKRLKNTLVDIRQTRGPGGGRIPSLNQGQVGYCWAHSSTMGHMLVRALMGLPYVKLSAFMVASIIKGGRDEGGWGALSLDFIEKNGQCTDAEWPEGSRDLRRDTPMMRAVAVQHKVVADWADLSQQMWSRNMAYDAVASLLFGNTPVVGDFNWWGHSVILLDVVDGAAERMTFRLDSGKLPDLFEFDRIWGMNDPVTGGFGIEGLNSWGDEWGHDGGQFTLTGQKAVTDGAVAPMATMAA